ncbi:MAG: hypothetical protein J6C85_05315 [Alphaproteobacteria bacterium]|nr:hypothetical protein [Alphaproteobacteria bacterium]
MYTDDVSVTVVHELAHLTADVFDADQKVKKAINRQDIHSQLRQEYNLAFNKKVTLAEIDPVIITDTDTPLVKPQVKLKQILTDKPSYKDNAFLKDNVLFDTYLDQEGEVYARTMQLRYKTGLKADTPVKIEDLNQLEMEYDGNIINRYKEEIVTSILNDVAVVSDVKTKMTRDAQSAQASMAQASMALTENDACLSQSSKESAAEQKKNKISDLILSKYKENFYS